MPAKIEKTGNDAINLMSPIFSNEDTAREFLESKRWPNGAECPRCDCKTVYKLEPKPESLRPVRPGVYKCKGCRKQFTVRIGTIFEESKLPLRKWLAAIFLMCSAKKGVSSHQLARELDVTVKTAWFLSHRIREAMKQEPLAGMIGGAGKTVEADETYIGARKPRYKGTSKRGRGTNKKPVALVVERDGNAHAAPVERVNGDCLMSEVLQYASNESILMTDELPVYVKIGKEFEKHESVNHGEKEYARDDSHVNTAESYFSLLKRAYVGAHHHYTARHLHRYVTERSFHWNLRKQSDGERMVQAIEGAEGKRLKYREPSCSD